MSLTVNVHIKNLHLPPPPAKPTALHLVSAESLLKDELAEWASAPVVKTAGIDIQAAPIHTHTRIAADGTHLPSTDTTTPHVAVIDHTTGLMWQVESLGNPTDSDEGLPHAECEQRCRDSRLLGFEDWRTPSRTELAGLIDDTRHEPAIDTFLFPRVKPRWHWTSTAAAWSSASAWFVNFRSGYVSYDHRNDVGFALAVRRAGQ